jgi:hypothetical protein
MLASVVVVRQDSGPHARLDRLQRQAAPWVQGFGLTSGTSPRSASALAVECEPAAVREDSELLHVERGSALTVLAGILNLGQGRELAGKVVPLFGRAHVVAPRTHPHHRHITILAPA